MTLLDRPIYTARIEPYIGKNLIKVLTGQRRVGKSYILKIIADKVRNQIPEANIISVNIEDFAFAHITNATRLSETINSLLKPDKRNFIFLDEIQEVQDFDKVVRSLALDENNDIYITGSNSAMLSSEMASRLAGRSVEFRIHPLSYSEFLDFHKLDDNDDALNLYIRYGGMPYLRNLNDKGTWNEYLVNITDAVVFRDVVARNSLRNIDFLQRLLLFLADNIGRIFTAKRIADYNKSQRNNGSVALVQSYIRYIVDAYIINESRRWDIDGKRYFEIGEKFFFEDIGIRNSLIGFRPQDIGGIIENIVYNHLRILNYEVKTGIIADGKEIDFIVDKDGECKYIQVAMTISEDKTFEREFGNLERIPDNYEKYVITLNDKVSNSYRGIKVMSLREFLFMFK